MSSSTVAAGPVVVHPSAYVLPLTASSSASSSSASSSSVPYSPSSTSSLASSSGASAVTYSSALLTVDVVLNDVVPPSASTASANTSTSPYMLEHGVDSPTPSPPPSSGSSSGLHLPVSSPPPPSDESAPATPFAESEISVPTSPGGTPLHASLPYKKAKTPRVPLTAIPTLGNTLTQDVFSFLEQLGQSGNNFDKYKDKAKKKPAGSKRKKGKSTSGRHSKKHSSSSRSERKSKKARKSKQHNDATAAEQDKDNKETTALPSSSASSSSASSGATVPVVPGAASHEKGALLPQQQQQHNHHMNGGRHHNHGHHHHHHHTSKESSKKSTSGSPRGGSTSAYRPYHSAVPLPAKPEPTTSPRTSSSRPKSPRKSGGAPHTQHADMMTVSPCGSRESGDVLSPRGSMLPSPPQFGRHVDPRRMPQLPFPLLPSPVSQQPPHHLQHQLHHPHNPHQHHNHGHQSSPQHLHWAGFPAPTGLLPGDRMSLPWPPQQQQQQHTTSASHPFLLPSTPPTPAPTPGEHHQHQLLQHQHQHQHLQQQQQQQQQAGLGFDISSLFGPGGSYDSSESIDDSCLSSLLNDATVEVGVAGEKRSGGGGEGSMPDGIRFPWQHQQEEFLLAEMLAPSWPGGGQQQNNEQQQQQQQQHEQQQQQHDVGNAGPHGQMLVADLSFSSWFS